MYVLVLVLVLGFVLDLYCTFGSDLQLARMDLYAGVIMCKAIMAS